MSGILYVLTRVSQVATGIAFSVMIAAVMIQVLGRMLGNSPVWTEELTRFALLYLAAFGVGLSYRSGDLVNVDLVSEALPGPWPRRLRLVSAFATMALCLALLVPAALFTGIGAMQTSPALGWRMDFIHVTMFVLLACLLVFSLAHAAAMLLGASDGKPDHLTDSIS